MKDIADKIHRTKPTVTVLVDKLEKLDLVKRDKSSEDNRITYIVLTEKGESFRALFEKISKELNTMLYKNLSEEEAETLEKLLEKNDIGQGKFFTTLVRCRTKGEDNDKLQNNRTGQNPRYY